MKLVKILMAFALVFAMVGTSFAASVVQRLETQQHRIDRGATHCNLSPRETNNLQSHLDRIRSRYNYMSSKGYLTPGERVALNDRLDNNNYRIMRMMRNGERCTNFNAWW